MSEKDENSNIRKVYEEGKQRRYNLLFAVNGGAFAVVQLLADSADLRTIEQSKRIEHGDAKVVATTRHLHLAVVFTVGVLSLTVGFVAGAFVL
jgi:hypothetical protein